MTTADRVLTELDRWRARFERGRLEPRGLRQPHLEDGERFGVKVPSVGVQQHPAGEPPLAWLEGLGGAWRGWRHAPLGALYVTDRRAFVHGNTPTDIRREWRWDEQGSVTLLPVPLGVAISPRATPETVDVVGSEWNKLVVSSTPNPRDLLTRWLQVEGVFASHQGHLAQWWAALPARLSPRV